MDDKEMSVYAHQFFNVMHKLKRIIIRCHNRNEVYEGEFLVIFKISELCLKNYESQGNEKGVLIGDLVKALNSTKSATSKMLRNLEEKGYIERETSEKDKRNVYIRLSESGKNVKKQLHSKFEIFSNEIIEELGAEETKELIKILNHLYEIVDRRTKDCYKSKHTQDDLVD